MNFTRVLKEVLWCLVTEGGISYRRIKLSFGLDDDGLEELRRELIALKRLAADVDGALLVWAPDGRAARPEPMALPQPLPALRHAEKPTVPAAVATPSPEAGRSVPSAPPGSTSGRPTTLARPQSTSSVSPKLPSMTLAGLRSRWITPRECA